MAGLVCSLASPWRASMATARIWMTAASSRERRMRHSCLICASRMRAMQISTRARVSAAYWACLSRMRWSTSCCGVMRLIFLMLMIAPLPTGAYISALRGAARVGAEVFGEVAPKAVVAGLLHFFCVCFRRALPAARSARDCVNAAVAAKRSPKVAVMMMMLIASMFW